MVLAGVGEGAHFAHGGGLCVFHGLFYDGCYFAVELDAGQVQDMAQGFVAQGGNVIVALGESQGELQGEK